MMQTASVLTLGSHNVRGWRSDPQRSVECVTIWNALNLDIVAVQETHADPTVASLVERTLHQAFNQQPPYSFEWCHYLAGNSRGVALAIKKSLLTSGAVQVRRETTRRLGGGRLVSVDIKWRGHQLRVFSVYAPADDAEGAKAAFIRDVLGPAVRDTPASYHPVVLGDFNFVEDPEMDRARPNPEAGHLLWGNENHRDNATTAVFRDELPSLVDTFRVRHPTRKAVTQWQWNSAARLDRIYLTDATLPFMLTSHVATPTTSDHRPVVMRLTARTASDVGPGLPRRARVDFIKDGSAADTAFGSVVAALVAVAPTEDDALLAWWPLFKASLRRAVLYIRRLVHQRTPLPPTDQLLAALQAVEEGQPGSISAALHARREYVTAVRQSTRAEAARMRHEWLHQQELPSPAITALMHEQQAGHIPSLVHPETGVVLSSGQSMANAAHAFWTRLSARPQVDAAATTDVLLALAALTPAPPQAALNSLHSAVVSEAAIRAELTKSKSGRAPGTDGIPTELWRKQKSKLVPLLARVYTAIGRTGQLPAGFADGAIKIIHKGGGQSALRIESYRPITLLNSDYRLWSKIMAARLGAVLSPIIDQSQTAFLKGRRIGFNIHLLQSLPAALARRNRSALVMFLDFRKAYDTVSREFILKALDVMGINGNGNGDCTYIKLLKAVWADGATCSVVNGFVSDSTFFEAGIKQGCPMAPVIYLVVAQALCCFLKWQGHGIGAPRVSVPVAVGAAAPRLTSSSYADDAQVFLDGPDKLPALLQDLDAFGSATGQRLNRDKCELMQVGCIPAAQRIPVGTTVHGIKVSEAVKTMGIIFTNACGDQPLHGADWPTLVDKVERAYRRVKCIGLSALGRGLAASAYGLSQLLFHAEFSDACPADILRRLEFLSHDVVALEVARSVVWHKPAQGGFGGMNFKRHNTARHAVWGLRLISGAILPPDEQPLWVATACASAARFGDPAPTSHHPFLLFARPALRSGRGPLINRWMKALDELRLPKTLPGPAPAAGPWCLGAPLWRNPCLTAELPVNQGREPRLWQTLDSRFGLAGQNAMSIADDPDFILTIGDAFNYLLTPYSPAFPAIHRLLGCLPPSWTQAAATAFNALPPIPGDMYGRKLINAEHVSAALRVIWPRLYWEVGTGNNRKAWTVDNTTVQRATLLQAAKDNDQGVMAERHRQFVSEAFAGEPQPAASTGSLLRSLRDRIGESWRLKWENKRKEAWWRLHLNGLRQFPSACPCGAGTSTRQHIAWDCPVAQAVRGELEEGLGGEPVLRSTVWLMRNPAMPQQHQPGAAAAAAPAAANDMTAGIWQVVCLAAVDAMSLGHRQLLRMWLALQLEVEERRRRHQAVDAMWAEVGVNPPQAVITAQQRAEIMAKAKRLAVCRFWEGLVDFAALRPQITGMTQHSPFLFLKPDGGTGVRVPADGDAPSSPSV